MVKVLTFSPRGAPDLGPFEVINVPLLELRPTINKEEVLEAVEWAEAVAFTSPTGVKFLFEEVPEIKEKLENKVVYAIGPKTKEELEKFGIRAKLPKEYHSASLAEELSKYSKVVAFRSDKASKTLKKLLGDKLKEVIIYDIKESSYLRKNQTMIVGDVLDEKNVIKAIKDAKYVYNFAGIADIGEASGKPIDTVKYNILGHTIILNACKLQGIERILFASSIYVYSDKGSFYRVSKQACELLTESFSEIYGLKYTILRYGSLYGPRAQLWNGVYRYVYHALINRKIDHPGTGDERREYIHVIDAARLSIEVLKPEFENEYVIITGTQSLTSRELLTMIREMLGEEVKINFTGQKFLFHSKI